MENEKKKNQIIENGNNEKGIVSISQTKLIADADLVLRTIAFNANIIIS